MKYFVERTCTVVRGREEEDGGGSESHPLESFRQKQAYVLLGGPGAGKTKAFEREAKEEEGHYITADNFLTLDPEPEWNNKTLYIDGLDEARASATDGHTPFNGIRRKLQRLGRPRFRLSCRHADWFGGHDGKRLEVVAPDGEVLVLRLDPLSDQGILDVLDKSLSHEDPKGFVAAARETGVDSLLRNPLNLEMLARAVADDEWPRTRAETFDMACQELVSEENPGHQIAWSGTASTAALLDAAGNLCAVLLLAGKTGVTIPGTAPDANHPRLDQVRGGDQQLLRRAVGTNLFDSPSEGRLVFAHRQVAEFLAARYLAELIADGLPVRRALALTTGFDGGVLSELRGLAAWLAAHSREARTEIIERDPLGMILYGDVFGFTTSDKRQVLKCLQAETVRNPWLVGDTNLDSPMGYLAGPDLEDDFRQALADPARDDAHQSFVLLVVQAIRSGPSSPTLAEPLMAIVRDDSRPMDSRCTALEAYVRATQGDPQVAAALRALLNEVYAGVVATQNDDLLGTLLMELYPDNLTVRELVGYLREPARRNPSIRYQVFWTHRLIEKSTNQKMVQLLDLLRVPMERVRTESGVWPRHIDLITRPPVLLLRHLLGHSPESIPREQLLHWLDFAGWLGQELEFSYGGVIGDAQFFRDWISDRPDIQKAIVENGVIRCREGDRDFLVCMRYAKRSLFGTTPPNDYGTWCADQALSAANDTVAHWFVWESAAFVYNAKGPGPRQREAIARKLRDDARLARLFDDRLEFLEEPSGLQEGTHRTPQAHPIPKHGRFDQLMGWVKENESALHENECRPDLLHRLAVAYFNGFSNVRGDTPLERLQYLLGPNDDLLDAALAGLRGAICRPDLPTWTEISKLAAEGRTHYLAYPFMVGLEELAVAAETSDSQLNESQTRLALAIHFALPRMRHADDSKRPPRWLRSCVTREPDTVAEVWAHCARAQLGRGERSLADTHRLDREPEYAQLAQAASVPLLNAFPVRCGAGQLPILGSLLGAAMAHGDRTQFLELIEAKLAYKSMNSGQRVYWLTAGMFVQPEVYGDRLESYVSGKVRRIQRLVEMTHGHAVAHTLRDRRGATVLEKLIRLIGPYTIAPPGTGEVYSVTWPIQADRTLHSYIDRLAEDTSDAASNALESLAKDDRLRNRRSELLDRLHRQKSIRREATFAHPSLERVAEVLDNGPPANVADLWALTVDFLRQLSREIRDGATSDWRQYWNVDQYNKAQRPKPENACRDALLSDLRTALAPLSIDAVAEGTYADDKRSDIRLSVPPHNVPIEIKRSCHRELWSAIQTQLIAKYTRDPGTDGYGIYLVFWFGDAEGCRPTPRSGPKPKSVAELEKALLDTLSDHERRKISVCVIDVSKPDA